MGCSMTFCYVMPLTPVTLSCDSDVCMYVCMLYECTVTYVLCVTLQLHRVPYVLNAMEMNIFSYCLSYFGHN